MIIEFIQLIVLLNIWAMCGSWLFYFIMSDEELQETADLACIDMILWPALLFNLVINRWSQRTTRIHTGKVKKA